MGQKDTLYAAENTRGLLFFEVRASMFVAQQFPPPPLSLLQPLVLLLLLCHRMLLSVWVLRSNESYNQSRAALPSDTATALTNQSPLLSCNRASSSASAPCSPRCLCGQMVRCFGLIVMPCCI